MTTTWRARHPQFSYDMLGFLPEFLSESDPAPVKKQIDRNYQHGGGWHPFGEGEWKALPGDRLQYPGDPVLPPLAETKVRQERVVFYPGELLAIYQPDGSFEVARVD